VGSSTKICFQPASTVCQTHCLRDGKRRREWERRAQRRETEIMDPTMYDLHSWSKQRREEAMREVQRRSLSKRDKGDRVMRFEPGHVGSALSGVLSLLR
jgi:hypothetical protein